jgi:hypothetical protein
MGLYLPTGASEMPEDFQRKLQYGYPEIGWPGDVNMFITKCVGRYCKNRGCPGWALMRNDETGRDIVIAHNPGSNLSNTLFKKLAERSQKTMTQVIDEIQSFNDNLENERSQRSNEAAEETADHLYDVYRRNN